MSFSEKHLFRCRCWYKRLTFSFIISIILTIILTNVIVINGVTIIIIIEVSIDLTIAPGDAVHGF